jgi:methionyl-tRNA formyltransferase
MQPPIPTLLCAHAALGLNIAHALHQNPQVNLVAVYPWCDHPKSQFPEYHQQLDAPLKQWAKEHGIPLLGGWKGNDPEFLDWLAQHNIAWMQLGCWGEILKPPLITQPNLTIVNCHPSLLPNHRGPNPYASVIRLNEAETGVSFHTVDAGIDTGPLLHQAPMPLHPTDTGDTVQQRCAEVAGQAMDALIALLTQPTWPLQPQDETQGVYYPNIILEDGLIQWMADPHAVWRNARAIKPWINSYGFWNGNTLVVTEHLSLVPHTPATPEEAERPAGVIHHTTNSLCQVTSRDPNWLYQFNEYQFVISNLQVPKAVSGVLGAWLLQPDKGSFWHTPMIEQAYLSALTPAELEALRNPEPEPDTSS